MDFTEAFEVLQGRVAAGNASTEESRTRTCEYVQSKVTELQSESSSTALNIESLSSIELLNLLTTLQGERTSGYKRFENALDELLHGESFANGDRLVEYPALCADMTATFAVLSAKVIKVKDALNSRGLHEIGNMVASIQLLEKEKLTLNAAMHLDMIQAVFPTFQDNLGFIAAPDYTVNKIKEMNERIAAILEDVQEQKCGLLDDEEK